MMKSYLISIRPAIAFIEDNLIEGIIRLNRIGCSFVVNGDNVIVDYHNVNVLL